jgi:hypothetical protein
MAFNPKSKSYEETATLNLIDPETDSEIEVEGKPVSITVYGKASKQHRKAVEVLLKRREDRAKQKKKETLETGRADSIEFLVALSVSSDNLEYNDELVETAEQFKELYSDEEISWVRDQVNSFISVDTNFFLK